MSPLAPAIISLSMFQVPSAVHAPRSSNFRINLMNLFGDKECSCSEACKVMHSDVDDGVLFSSSVRALTYLTFNGRNKWHPQETEASNVPSSSSKPNRKPFQTLMNSLCVKSQNCLKRFIVLSPSWPSAHHLRT